MRVDHLAAALLLPVTPLAGQQTVRLRYDPAPGFGLTTVTEVRTITTVAGLPTIPDGATFEELTSRFARQRVRERGSAGWVVDISLDSVRTRWRPTGGAWRDAPRSPLDGSTARARINERFAVTGVESSGERDAEVLRALTGWMAGLGFAFPDAPAGVGTGFDTGARLAYPATLAADSSLPLRELVLGDLALRLDSVTDRGADTLMHFSFQGAFTPRVVQTAGEGGAMEATFQGGFAGRLIWSTGWDAFVSGAARVEVRAQATTTGPAGAVRATVDWRATISHRVRP